MLTRIVLLPSFDDGFRAYHARRTGLSKIRASGSRGDDPVPEHPDPFDLGLDHVADLKPLRRIEARPDAGRSAGGQDVARPERHAGRQHLDQLRDLENHDTGISGLADLPVDTQVDLEFM